MPDAIQNWIADLDKNKISQNPQPLVSTVDNAVAALNEIETAIGGGIIPSTIVLTDNHILVGNASNVATDVPMSGDATIVASGAITVTKSGGVAFGSAAFQASSAFDAAGSAATAQANAEAFTTSQINGGTPGTISPPAISLPTSKIAKGDGSAHGSAVFDRAQITCIIDGGGSVIPSGKVIYQPVEFAAQITDVTVVADQSGSITVNIWKCTYAQFDAGATHPVSGDSITASDTPALSSATKYTDSTLTGWTTTINQGDILAFEIPSTSTAITRVTAVLGVNKT